MGLRRSHGGRGDRSWTHLSKPKFRWRKWSRRLCVEALEDRRLLAAMGLQDRSAMPPEPLVLLNSSRDVSLAAESHNAFGRADAADVSISSLFASGQPSHAAAVSVPAPAGWTAQGPSPTQNGQVEGMGGQTNPVVGAIHTVAAHPTDANILYVGAVGGGIWKTTNATSANPNWTSLTDFEDSLSTGAMEFDPTDATHQTLVAGIGRFSSFGGTGGPQTGLLRTTDGGATWEPLGQVDLAGVNISGVGPRGSRILVSANGFNGGVSPGVYLSIDDGVSFNNISGLNGLANGPVFDLVGDPGDADTFYVGVGGGGGGVFRTDNAGDSWTDVSDAAILAAVGGNTNNIELAVHDNAGGGTNAVYVGIVNNGRMTDILRSGNQGGSWTAMDVPTTLESPVGIASASNATPIVITSNNNGRRTGQQVRISGVTGNTAANGDWTITVVNNNQFSLNGSAGNGAYAGGGVFQTISDLQPRLTPGGQGATHFSIAADPTNPFLVYIGGDRQDTPFPNSLGAADFSGRLFRGDASVAATGAVPSVGIPGTQWTSLTHSGTNNASAPHADSREMVFDAAGRLIETDDGGIYRRTNPTSTSGGWSSLNNNLAVTEFHDIAWDSNSNIIIGGAQDTGTPQQTATGSGVWRDVLTADGGDVVVGPDPSDASQSIRYSSRQNLGGFRAETYDASNNQVGAAVFPALTLTGGGNPLQGAFVTPLALNEIDPARLLIQGANSLYETTDQGATIQEIGVGVNTQFGQNALVAGGVRLGVDNADVLYAGSGSQVFTRTSAGGPVAATATAFPGSTVQDIALDPADWQTAYVADPSGVYQTTNAGASWTDITGDLVSAGLNTLSYLPAVGFDALLVGAVEGVFATATTLFNGASTQWLELGTDLPNAPVWDSDYDAAADVLLVGTLGRGAWTLANASDAVTGEVSGTVWADLNGDGIQDVGELGISGVTVRLMDPVDGIIGNGNDVEADSVFSNGSGDYLFDTIVPGDYYVEFVEPVEHAISPRDQGADDSLDSDPDRLTGRTDIFSVLPGGVDDTVDAGLIVPDRFEQNDSFAAAADLGVLPGVHINQLTISEAGDDDWYRLELLRPDDVDVEINFTHAFGNLDLEVTDDLGVVLPGGSSTGTTDTETVSLTGLSAGTYYVHVFGVGGAVNVYDIAMDPGATSLTRMIYVNDGSLTNDFYTLALGNDLNDGLSHLTPKATVQSVLDTYDLGVNDLVAIDTGTYTGTVDIVKEDEAAAFAGTPHSGGGTGSDYTNGGTRWELIDSDFNIVFLVTFGGSNNGTGIYAHGDGVDPSTNNLFRDNVFTGTSHAIRIDGGASDVVRDNIVSGSGTYGVYLPFGGQALIEGNTISGRSFGIRGGANGLDLEIVNNDLTNMTHGIWLDNSDGTAEIRDNTIATMAGRGIFTSVATATIRGNDISLADVGIETDDAAPLVFDNNVHDSNVGIRGFNVIGAADWASGLENDIHGNGIGVDAENGATVRFNRIHGNTTGILVHDNISIHHNVLYRNTGQAIHLDDGDNVDITNNTIYTPSGDGIRLENFSSAVSIHNNIVWTAGSYDIYVATDSQVGFESDYNNLFTSGSGKVVWWQKEFNDLFDWQVEADYDTHSIGTTTIDPVLDDPNFVNLGGDDYHLTDIVSTSIDAGDKNSGFANEPAPAGDRINLGAYGNTSEAAVSPTAYIAIDHPNYYTDWLLETPDVILWHAFGLTGDVDIDLYQQGVGKIDDLGTVPLADESFTWTPISSGLAGSTTDRFFIRLTSVAMPAVQEDSREVFSVPPVTTSFYIDDGDPLNTNDEYTPAASGDNRNTGTSPLDPKANLLPLLRNYDLGPGDSVRIDTGNYDHVRNVILSGGVGLGNDEGATYTGPTNLAKVARIDRANPFAGSTNIDVTDGDFVAIENLTLVGGERGLWVHNGSTNFTGSNLVLEGNSKDGIVLEADAAASSVDSLTAFDNGRDGIVILTPINTLGNSSAYSNSRYGIYVTGTGTSVSDNEVYGNGSYGIYAVGTTNQPTITVENNEVYDNLNHGIYASNNVLVTRNASYGQTGTNDAGIFLQSGAIADENVVHSNFDGIAGYVFSSVTITNNRVYNNSRYGIAAYNNSDILGNQSYSNSIGIQTLQWGRYTGELAQNLVYDNTNHGIVVNYAGAGSIVANNTVFQEVGDAIRVQASSVSLLVRNNILWATSATGHAIHVEDDSQSGFDADFNLFFREDPGSGLDTGQTAFWQGGSRTTLGDWRNASFQDANSLSTDPLFVDADGTDGIFGYVDAVNDGRDDDFHLMSTEGRFTGALTPVIDAGTGLPTFLPSVETTDGAQSSAIDRGDATFDFSNEPTPNGGFINIGAYGNTTQASKSPAQYVLVTRPDGGEVWPAEQTFSVRWRTNPVSLPGDATTYAAAVLADAPVAYWRLGEAAGTVAADETTNHDGTYTNGVMLGETGIFPTNTAAQFDGVNDVVLVPDDPTLRPAQISVEAWVKPEAGVSTFDSVLMKATSSAWNDGYGLFYNSSGQIQFFINQYNVNFVTGAIPLDAYSHVVATYDQSEIKLYINGSLVDSRAYTDPINHATTDLRIGQGQGSSSYTWIGDLDEVAVYNAALDPEQISRHHNQGPGGHGEVDIELFDVSLATVVETIDTASVNDGEFLWTIPASVPPDTDYRVRITHTTTTETDDSNADFEITPPISIYYVNDGAVQAGDWTTAVGSAANDGLSPATPKDSIRGVLDQYELGPGDIIRVDDGNYAVTSNILITSADPGVTVEGYHDMAFPGRMAVLDRGNTAQDVFQVSTDGVTLSYLHITGGRDGVRGVSAGNLTVQNSSIHGNDRYGVYLDSGSASGMVLGNTFDGTARTQDYGLFAQGADVTVTGNTAFDHFQRGIYVTGDGATVDGANETYGNRTQGIYVQNSSGATVTGNISHNNDSYGIYVTGATNEAQSIVSDNQSYANLNHGIYASSNVLVTGNTSYGQTGTNDAGIFLQSGAIADENVVHSNFDGIDGQYFSSVTITNNRVYNNSRYGIAAYNNSDILGNRSYSNSIGIQTLQWGRYTGELAQNVVYDNANQGIVVNYAGAGGTVANNTVFQEVGDALRVQASSESLLVRNNILWATSATGHAIHVENDSQSGFDSDYNLFYFTDPVSLVETGRLGFWEGVDFTSRVDWFYELGFDGSSIVANPDFVDYDGPDGILGYDSGTSTDHGGDDDFHLMTTSPAIDRGDPLSYYLAEPVESGGRANAGAYGNTAEATPSPAELVQVLSPNGFEKYEVGQPVEIQWRSWGLDTELFVGLINSGGPTVDNWLIDAYRENGFTASFANSVNVGGLADPAPEAVYQTYAYAPFGIGNTLNYALPVPDGAYDVRLHFAEPSTTGIGVRVFDVLVNGSLQLDNYDIVASVGNRYIADAKSFSAVAAGGGGLEIELINETASGAVLAAIELRRANPGGAADPTVDLALSTNNGGAFAPITAGLLMDRFGRGQYAWVAGPETGTNTALIRALANDGTMPQDDSDEAFLIANAGTDYYVDDGSNAGDVETPAAIGDNANSGKAPTAPMASLLALLAAYDLDPGDVIHVDTGSYQVIKTIVVGADDAGVTIEGPISATARLDRGNLTQDVMQIQSDDVTIDRLEITGGRDGVRGVSAGNLTVQNSSIHGNDRYGVYLDSGSASGMVLGNTFDGTARTQDYGLFAQGTDVTVTGNTAFDHFQRGIYVTGDGATVDGANETYGNRSQGIYVQNSSGAQVTGNISHNNDSYGIYVSGSTNEAQSIVSNNESYSNLNHGIYASGNVLVTGNTSYGQTGTNDAGILLQSGAIADENVVHSNFDGIDGYVFSSVTITNNRVYNNSRYGIAAYNNSDILGNRSYSNSIGIQTLQWGRYTGELAQNVVYDNANQGIVVNYAGAGGIVANNTVFQEVGDALRVQASSESLRVRNNILWATSGFVINVADDSQIGFDSDFNLFHTTGTAKLGLWNGVEFTDRSDWFYETGADRNSLATAPDFVNRDGPDGILGYDSGTSTDHGGDDDFHLMTTSPAIDMGDPAFPFDNEPAPNGERINSGAYGNTTEATTSPTELIQVLSPNGMEKFEVGQDVTIRWHSAGLTAAGTPDTNYESTVLGDNPIAYFRLGEAAGTTANDASGAPLLDGTFVGAPTLGTQGVFGAGLDTAVAFDGVDDYVEVADPGDLDLRRQVSFSFWMNVDSFNNTWNPLIYKGDGSSSTRTYSLWLRSNGYLLLTSSDANGQQTVQTASGTIQTGQWYHVAGVVDRDAGEMRIYVDGVEKASTSALRTNDTVSHNAALRIGWTNESSSSYSPIDGTLDEVAIFDHALTAAQIANQHANPVYTDVNIELIDASTSLPVLTIASSQVAPGVFNWTIPGTVTTDAEYRIRVTANDGSMPEDDSNEPFVITHAGTDYYVNDSTVLAGDWTTAIGDNAKSGKSPDLPMASLQTLLAAYDLDPGDVIHIDTGAYQLLNNAVVGVEDAGVRIEGFNDDAFPTRVADLDRNNSLRDVIVVAADQVTVAYLVIGGGRDGVRGVSAGNLTVENSSIHGNDRYGVYLDSGSASGMVLGNTFDGTARTQDYGVYAQGADVTVTGNTAFDHSQRGIYVTGDGATVDGANETYGNRTQGIYVQNSSGATVTGNISHNNDSYGIYVSGATNEAQSTVSNNESYANLNHGIYASSNVLVTGNTSYGQTGTNDAGIFLQSGAIADENVVHSNFDGIVGHIFSSPTITNNRVYNNSRYGIAAYNNSDILGNQSYSNSIGIQALVWGVFTGDIENNLIYANTNQGIVVNRAGAGGVVTNNTVFQEVGDALRVQDSSVSLVVRNNILWVEAGFAIFVDPNSQSGFDSDYNLFQMGTDPNAHVGFWDNEIQDELGSVGLPGTWRDSTGQDVNSLATAAVLVDPNGADDVLGYSTAGSGFDGGVDDNFLLAATSPAIDRADSFAAPLLDKDGNPRVDDPGTSNGGSNDYAESNLGSNAFDLVGTAQNWRSTDNRWNLALPFTFNFYGVDYSSVWVTSNGLLQFATATDATDPNNTTAKLLDHVRIAPLWDDLHTNRTGDDIFVDTSTPGEVTVRWDATNAADEGDVNFSVTLVDTGVIRFDYGSGNTNLTPTVGISAGDGEHFEIATLNSLPTLTDADTLEFIFEAGIADIGAYEFQGSSLDVDPPTVANITPAEIDSGGATPLAGDEIQIVFTEALNPIDATAVSNYDFRTPGANMTYDDVDDFVYTVTPIYTTGSTVVTLQIVGGVTTGEHRLTLRGNDSIHDLAGLRLDGDNNGAEGGNYVRVFTVGTTPPTVTAVERNGGGQNFDELVTLDFTFSEDVSASLDKFDLMLVNTSTAAPVDLTPTSVSWNGGTNTATWDLTGAMIDTGFHTATLSAAGITNGAGIPLDGDGDLTGGDDFVTTVAGGLPLLVALAGDTNLDGQIDNGDILNILAANSFNNPAGGPYTWAEGDFNSDTVVDNTDILLILATGQFGTGAYAALSSPATDAPLSASTSPGEPITFSAPGVSLPLSVARVQTPAPAVPVSKIEPIDRAAVFDAMYTAALLADSTEQSFPFHDSPVSFGPSGDLVRNASDALTGLGTGTGRLERAQPVRRLQRNISAREVDLALTDLVDEPVDRREHDRLAIERHARRLDPVWDEALIASLPRPTPESTNI